MHANAWTIMFQPFSMIPCLEVAALLICQAALYSHRHIRPQVPPIVTLISKNSSFDYSRWTVIISADRCLAAPFVILAANTWPGVIR